MRATPRIHDAVVEATVRGEPAPARALELVAGGKPSCRSGRKRMPGIESAAGLGGKVAGLGLVAKLGLGTSIAAAGVVGAGVVGMLPASANQAVRGAVEVVTPVNFDKPDKPNFGQRVSADATGDSDGEHGVDGQQISDEAPGAAHRNGGARPDEPPGQSGVTGQARADQTPAADHAPDTPGAPSADAGKPDTAGQPADAGVGGVSGASGRPATVPSTVPAPAQTERPAGG
ncbi:MAG TPA: hypothetical protein VKB57_12305 [Acidimicrobiales bacterium]|nr:hypothetical protein [Acidimicrobiales bacterium]